MSTSHTIGAHAQEVWEKSDKFKGSWQKTGRKVVPHDTKSDLPLMFFSPLFFRWVERQKKLEEQNRQIEEAEADAMEVEVITSKEDINKSVVEAWNTSDKLIPYAPLIEFMTHCFRVAGYDAIGKFFKISSDDNKILKILSNCIKILKISSNDNKILKISSNGNKI